MSYIEKPDRYPAPFEAIDNIRTIFDAMQVLRKVCLSYRFSYFSVISLPSASSSEDHSIAELATISSWPPELIAEYDRAGLARNSPILERLRKQISPLVFEVDAINNARPGEEPKTAGELFGRFGLTRGVYFPVHDSLGLRQAVSFMGSREPLAIEELSALSLFSTMLVEQISRISSI